MNRSSLIFILFVAMILALAGGDDEPVNAWNPIYRPDSAESSSNLSDLWFMSLPGPDSQALFEEGLEYFEEGKYYSARRAFYKSGLPEAEELAEQCVQDWPENAEIWRGDQAMISTDTSDELRLEIKTGQEAETAALFRISRIGDNGDAEPVSVLFIGGKDSVTITLSQGTFMIETERGSEWYGIEEAFGENHRYEIMAFDYEGTAEVSLMGGFFYTITDSWEEPEPDWRDF